PAARGLRRSLLSSRTKRPAIPPFSRSRAHSLRAHGRRTSRRMASAPAARADPFRVPERPGLALGRDRHNRAGTTHWPHARVLALLGPAAASTLRTARDPRGYGGAARSTDRPTSR